MFRQVEQFLQRLVYYANRIPEGVAAVPLYISAETFLKPLYVMAFSGIFSISVLFWSLDSILLYIAYMLHNLRRYLVLNVFSSILDIFLGGQGGAPGVLAGIIRSSFMLAVLLLGFSYIARAFLPRLRLVDPSKLILWGGVAVLLLGTGAASSAYQNVEAFREDLSTILYSSVFEPFRGEEGLRELANAFDAEGVEPPQEYSDPLHPGGVAPVLGYPSGEEDDPDIRSYHVAGAFIRATMDDVLHPCIGVRGHLICRPLPAHYPDNASFMKVFWWDMSPVDLGNLDEPDRSTAMTLVFQGLVRLILGIIPCLLGVIEAVIFLCLTIATGILFCTLPIALIFAFFEYTEPIAAGIFKSYLNIFVKTMTISILFSIIQLLLLAAALLHNPVVLVGTTILGIIFGISFTQDSLQTMVNSVQSFSKGLGQAVGMKPIGAGMGQKLMRVAGGAIGGVAGMAGAAALAGLAGEGGAGMAGAMLGRSRGLSRLAYMAETAGAFGDKTGGRTQSLLRSMRMSSLAGRSALALPQLMTAYRLKQVKKTEQAGEKYRRAYQEFESDTARYETDLPAAEKRYEQEMLEHQEGEREAPPDRAELLRLKAAANYDQQKKEYEDGERTAPPELPKHLRDLREAAEYAGQRPFMGGMPTSRRGDLPMPKVDFSTAAQRAQQARRAPGRTAAAAPTRKPGPLGGEILGTVDSLDPVHALDHLQSGFALTTGPGGKVEAVPTTDLFIPPDAVSVVPTARMDDPTQFLRQGWSMAPSQDGEVYLLWQQEYPEGVADVGNLQREAQAAVERHQSTGRVARPAPPSPPVARPAAVQADAPAMPLTGVTQRAGLVPSPATRPGDCAQLDASLARHVQTAFRRTTPGQSPSRSWSADPAALRKAMMARLVKQRQEVPDRGRHVIPAMEGAITTMQQQGISDNDIALTVFDEEGAVQKGFAECVWAHAGVLEGDRTVEDAYSQVAVGRSPVIEREFAVTQAMGPLARHSDAAMVRAARVGLSDPGGMSIGVGSALASTQELSEGLSSAYPGIASERDTIQSVTMGARDVSGAMSFATLGETREQSLQALRPAVGTSAGEVYDCMQRHTPEESIAVVRATEQVVSELRAGGMDQGAIASVVYTSNAEVRPEFLDAVVSRTQDGAVGFVDTEEGIDDLGLLVAAGLGMEKMVSGDAILEAIGTGVETPGLGGAGAGNVAARLHIPEIALENGGAVIGSFMSTAKDYGLTKEEAGGIIRSVRAGQGIEAQQELIQRLVAEGRSEESVQQVMRDLRGLGRGVPRSVRAGKVFRRQKGDTGPIHS